MGRLLLLFVGSEERGRGKSTADVKHAVAVDAADSTGEPVVLENGKVDVGARFVGVGRQQRCGKAATVVSWHPVQEGSGARYDRGMVCIGHRGESGGGGGVVWAGHLFQNFCVVVYRLFGLRVGWGAVGWGRDCDFLTTVFGAFF